jgi:hypothetical protein
VEKDILKNNCEHEFIEIFSGSDNKSKPIKVCGKCHRGYDVKRHTWYSAREVYRIKAKLKYLKEET